MGKARLFLLMFVVILIPVMAGYFHQPSADQFPSTVGTSFSNLPFYLLKSGGLVFVPACVHNTADDLNSSHAVWSFYFDGSDQQPLWIRLVDKKVDNFKYKRSYLAGKPFTNKKFRNEITIDTQIPVLFSRNLLESSPPGCFLLI